MIDTRGTLTKRSADARISFYEILLYYAYYQLGNSFFDHNPAPHPTPSLRQRTTRNSTKQAIVKSPQGFVKRFCKMNTLARLKGYVPINIFFKDAMFSSMMRGRNTPYVGVIHGKNPNLDQFGLANSDIAIRKHGMEDYPFSFFLNGYILCDNKINLKEGSNDKIFSKKETGILHFWNRSPGARYPKKLFRAGCKFRKCELEDYTAVCPLVICYKVVNVPSCFVYMIDRLEGKTCVLIGYRDRRVRSGGRKKAHCMTVNFC
ncbi:conserved Plasmodium protein, unknown function [Plasmodium ovale curtisi]|uniref:Uncharacterized protein n=1 Tax=Plasmodium ovale curtisi TaxID=864141 RepID=A0A1A8W4G9_PLAOA|nr:conserved Plasmodium protein, unknown function [Plasmodium ovale curtisi]